MAYPRSVVWLKRDLRLRDHAPLAASAEGPALVLFIDEPSLYTPEGGQAPCHQQFIVESLHELAPRIRELGGRLVYARGEAPDVLARLYNEWPFDRLLSHQETGNDLTYRRDRAVGTWCRRHDIDWHQFRQHGVFRPLGNRDGWAARWRAQMNQPQVPEPTSLSAPDVPLAVETDLPGPKHDDPPWQRGGESLAHQTLLGFLKQRGQRYTTEMSSPVTAWDACSRLSPHFAWGTISMRQVFQLTEQRAAQVRSMRTRPRYWGQSLNSFGKRLRWHCHFIQKLEDQPDIQFQNMQRSCDGLREEDFNDAFFAAWKAGETGYPMVDACMRALIHHKWINFRMRAMLVSFASYHLWLDWRPTSKWLAQHFIDYEPGIHYSQFQMQSGVTGINAVRIYSPAKQVLDHDPEGTFIHRWCPELAGLTGKDLAEPQRVQPDGYPAPIVDHRTAVRAAKERVWAVRRTAEAKAESRAVYRRHGSRKRPERRAAQGRAQDRAQDRA